MKVRNIIKDSTSSTKTSKRLMNGIQKNKLPPLESMNSLILPLKNSSITIPLILCQECLELNKLKYYLKIILKLPSIGKIEVLLLLSKTKDNVVHVGLSPPLVLLKVLSKLLPVLLPVYLNNNLLIVLHKTWDVREV
jgi:hypothetical protein